MGLVPELMLGTRSPITSVDEAVLLPLEPTCNTLNDLGGKHSNELRHLERATHRAHEERFFHLHLLWELGKSPYNPNVSGS